MKIPTKVGLTEKKRPLGRRILRTYLTYVIITSRICRLNILALESDLRLIFKSAQCGDVGVNTQQCCEWQGRGRDCRHKINNPGV